MRTIMISSVPPAAIFIFGALFVPFLKGRIKSVYLLSLPVLGLINLFSMTEGIHWLIPFLDYNIILGRVDRLSMVFGYIFTLVSFIAFLYALHVEDNVQHIAALVYAGSALGVTYAGDLISLYIFWELLAVSAVFLVWARRTNSEFSRAMV